MIDFLLLLEVVPLEWLQYYDERELELIICGMQERVWNRASQALRPLLEQSQPLRPLLGSVENPDPELFAGAVRSRNFFVSDPDLAKMKEH